MLDEKTRADIHAYVLRKYDENPPPPLTAHQRAVIAAMFRGARLPVLDDEEGEPR